MAASRVRIARPLPILVGALALLAAPLLAACGGGGGGAGSGGDAAFLTADPRGMAGTGGVPAAGEPAAGGAGAGLDQPASAPPSGLPDTDAGNALGALSKEIEEADLHRVDGDTLYLLNAYRGLAILDLATFTLRSRLALGGVPHEMLVRGTRAFVFLSGADGAASLVEVSLADPAAPSVASRTPLVGGYRASRLVGDVLTAVTDDGAAAHVRSFSIAGPLAPVGSADVAGGAAFVCAADGLWVLAGWSEDGIDVRLTLVSQSPAGALATGGHVDLAGWISDEQKLDVWNGVLRVVTHDPVDQGLSRLTTISVANPAAPTVLGALEIARGESLFATRFDGDRAYVVTFFRVDPLWVIDLSDPTTPRIAGSLTVPGWSTHLIAMPGRLVALGTDPSTGWDLTASLFDVTDAAHPTLLDRESLAGAWSTALYDVKGLGVFPAEGLVLVPVSSDRERLAVLSMSADALTLRGTIETSGPVLRGFPHARGLTAISSEEVVVADPVTLAVRGRVTIAEEVVDAARLPGGTLLPLVRFAHAGRLGGVDLPLVPEHAFPVGSHVAVTGWDDLGRAAYVVDFSSGTPALSERFDLGGAPFALGFAPWSAPGVALGWGGYGVGDVLVTDGGRLVVHGTAGGWIGGGTGGGGVAFLGGAGAPGSGGVPDPGSPGPVYPGPIAADGFVVIDVVGSHLEPAVDVDGVVTGFAVDGEDLLFTTGDGARPDAMGRPRMSHELTRLDLVTRASSVAANVPGYVVAARDGLAFTAEERWTDGWSFECALDALSVDGAGVTTVLSSVTLPPGAYDLRAAGATLVYTTGSAYLGPAVDVPAMGVGVAEAGGARPEWDGGGLWLPTSEVGVVRLSAALAAGPTITLDGTFLSVLLAEDGAVVVSENGLTLERFDVSGPVATSTGTLALEGYPLAVRGDGPGAYLVALGYGGLVSFP